MTLDEMIGLMRKVPQGSGTELDRAILAELERRRPVCEREGHKLVMMLPRAPYGTKIEMQVDACPPILCERCGRAPGECR